MCLSQWTSLNHERKTLEAVQEPSEEWPQPVAIFQIPFTITFSVMVL
jgi:hypothetical protein